MKEDKATQYVNQKMMPHLINQQSMAEKPLFTSLDHISGSKGRL